MTHSIPPEFQIGRLAMSLWVPQAIHAAAELGIADALARGPATAAAVADVLRTDQDATRRLLDALVVLGVVRRERDAFALTPLGECLRDDGDASRRAWARLMGGADVWRAWGSLADCVRTGRAAWTSGPGARTSETETFDALFADPDAANVFHRAMADGTRSAAPQIASALALDGASTIVDVGGGWGELLCAALEARTTLRGAVFDLAHAEAGARATFERRGLAERAAFVTGDLFAAAPPAADVLVLKSVVHDWSDERSLALLGRCRDAMRPGDRLAVVEPAAPEPGTAVPEGFAWIVAFSDLNMLVNTGGKERTRREYTALIEGAGLAVRAVRDAGFYSCFEATLR